MMGLGEVSQMLGGGCSVPGISSPGSPWNWLTMFRAEGLGVVLEEGGEQKGVSAMNS